MQFAALGPDNLYPLWHQRHKNETIGQDAALTRF